MKTQHTKVTEMSKTRQQMLNKERTEIMPHLMADIAIGFYGWLHCTARLYFKSVNGLSRIINDEAKAILVNRYCLIAITAWQNDMTLIEANNCYLENTLPALNGIEDSDLLSEWCEQTAIKKGYAIEDIYQQLKASAWLPSDFQTGQLQGGQR